MRLWYPNTWQWRVIFAVYVAAFLVSVDWTSPAVERRPLTTEERREQWNRRAERRLRIDRELDDERFDWSTRQARRNHRLRTDPMLSSPLQTEREILIERFDPQMSSHTFLLFLVIGGMLAVWKLHHSG
jgi:hypothetical protein